MKGLARWAAAVVMAGTATIAQNFGPTGGPLTVWANSACQSGYNPLFDGYELTSKGGWGTSAYIVTRSSNWCTEPPNDPLGDIDSISAWSMVEDYRPRQDAPYNYAQSGYGKERSDGSQNYVFAEYTYTACPGGACSELRFVTTTGGDNFEYWSAYKTASPHNYIDMRVGDCNVQTCDDILQTEYNPTDTSQGNNYWPGPWGQQYSGETRNAGNDVPGSSGYKASFTSVAWQPNQWTSGNKPVYQNVGTSPVKNINPTKGYYCFQNTGASSFNIWTSGTC